MARIIFDDFREPAASAAYQIAFNFLTQSDAVRDEYETSIFLAQFLTRMVDEGHGNKILMANRAISAYQARLAEGGRQIPRRQAQQTQSMEQLLGRQLAGRHAGE